MLEAGLTGHNLQWKANFGVLCERLILASANNEGVRQKIYYIAMIVLSETGGHLTIFAKNTIILIYLRLLFQIDCFFFIYISHFNSYFLGLCIGLKTPNYLSKIS